MIRRMLTAARRTVNPTDPLHLRIRALPAANLEDGTPCVGLWPPRVKGMPEGLTRCRACWGQTGKPRPRTNYRQEGPRP